MNYEEQIKAIEVDMEGKRVRRDWHGVMDCAADLRELEAREKGRIEGQSAGRVIKYPPGWQGV